MLSPSARDAARKAMVPLALALLLGACGDLFGPEDVLTFRAEPSSYQSGEVATAVLSNETDHTYYHGGSCFAEVQRRSAAGWETFPEPSPFLCPLPLYTIRPGDEAVYSKSTDGWPAGEFRFVASVGREHDRSVPIYSTPFALQ